MLKAGLLRCNISNPCTGIVLENVQVRGGLSAQGYVCDDYGSVLGTTDDLSSPDPSVCVKTMHEAGPTAFSHRALHTEN